MWSTLPPTPPEHDLPLVDPDYNAKLLSSSPCSPSFSFQQSIYSKLLAMRCSNRMRDIATSDPVTEPSTLSPAHPSLQGQGASFDISPGDEDRGQDYPQIDDPITRSLQQRSNSIDQVLQEGCGGTPSFGQENGTKIMNWDLKDMQGKHCRSDESHNSSPQYLVTDDDVTYEREQHRSNSECLRTSFHGDSCQNMSKIEMAVILTDACSSSHSVSADKQNIGNSAGYDNASLEFGTADLPEDGLETELSVNSHLQPKDSDPCMQFNLTLDTDSVPAEQLKKDAGDGYAGFFTSMKKLLSSPKRRPADIVIPNEISSNQNTVSNTSLMENASDGACHPFGNSDSGVSECTSNEASGSWTGSQQSQAKGVKQSWGQTIAITLAPPQEFGNGNPFLMFLCLTLLLQHRNEIMQAHMGYEDVAMYFDKMVRRHNVHRVLHQARELYSEYLRSQQALAEQESSGEYGVSV